MLRKLKSLKNKLSSYIYTQSKTNIEILYENYIAPKTPNMTGKSKGKTYRG